MTLLECVKNGFTPPIKSAAYDVSLTALINTCIIDLANAGAIKFQNQKTTASSVDPDPMLVHACVLSCKANGYDDAADRYGQAYEHFKNSLAISRDYSGGKDGKAG